jgi:hypothetical protein
MLRTAPATDLCEYLGTVVRGIPASKFRQNGYGRRFASHTPVDDAVVCTLFKRFGLDWVKEEPIFGHFVGNNFLPGAAVHRHCDSAPEGYHHVRCNVALKMPVEGGNPVLSDVELPVSEKEAWICFASLEYHGSTPVVFGNRVVVSLGGLIDATKAEDALAKIKAGS